MRKALALLVGLLFATPCLADPPVRMVPLGFTQVTSPSVATNLTPPAGATYAVIVVETQAIRWRDDGVAPTAGVGMLQAVTGNGPVLVYVGNLNSFQFIQATAGAVVDIAYYR